MAAICQTKKGEDSSGGSDLAVASGAADRQSVGGAVEGGRHRRRGSHTGEVRRVADPDSQGGDGGVGGDGWGN